MWFNPITSRIMRSPLHGMVSKNMMLVSYTGRKSGQRFSTPVNYLEMTENGQSTLYTISYRERVWWRNLRGGAAVSVRLRGRDIPAQAQVFEEPQQAAGELEVYLRQAPKLGRYIGVSMDAGGAPNADELAQASQKMVVIKTTLDRSTEN